MTLSDLPEIAAIEKESYSDAWSLGMFSSHVNSGSAVNFVLENEQEIIGYACNTSLPGFFISIDNITIREEFRRRGYASMLVEQVIQTAQANLADNVTLEVRESNQAAVNLYLKLGFVLQGRRKRYYRQPVEDALIMTLHLSKAK
ncbi:MAG: ribosomal protein S18-alanine N-acetyltransferase [candidate division Zixibacteria bacterium]|nr:ribosomal protein S18-alanine N-acetyltransferase [candidate division Zixibacteria bacterium]